MRAPVLIVGGGGSGLCASIFLSGLGVDHVLVERHEGTSHLPKAHYLNQRTMEIFRQHGVAEAVMKQGATLDKFGRVRFQTSLGGDGPFDGKVIFEIEAFGGGSLGETYAADGPILPTNLPQIRLEPLLRKLAEERAPGKILFGHELVSWENADQVRAVVRDRRTGESITIEARYLIAADGGKTVGPQLGVRMEGPPVFAEVTTVHFAADLSRWWQDGPLITWLVNPFDAALSGAALVEMGPTWGKHSEEWGLHFALPPGHPARADQDLLVQRIRDVLKLPDLAIEVKTVSHWELQGVLADRYRVGPTFLIGDAAHRHPPATGLGLNTGIQDAHNLCWKLAQVLSGAAGESLLDSYEPERRPVGRRNVDWAMFASANHQMVLDAAMGLGGHIPPPLRPMMFGAYFDDSPMGQTARARGAEIFMTHRAECQAHDIELGVAYANGALVPDGTEAPPRDPMGSTYHPTARPGHRLPHAWVEKAGRRVSTHDFNDGGTCFALLTGPKGAPWYDAAGEVEKKTGVRVRVASIGQGADWADTNGQWARLAGIGEGGAVLVRPDNHVAFRSADSTADPVASLVGAVESVLARRPG